METVPRCDQEARSERPSRLVVFALGANLGDRVATLRAAALRLAEVLEEPRVSPVYVTPPEGDADQPDYANAVVAGRSGVTPREALALARELEEEGGRMRPYPGASRTLDVDVLFVGETTVDQPDLRIPHPRWRTRPFVVVPLLDVVPDLVDPETGRTVSEIARSEGWGARLFSVLVEQGDLIHQASPETR